jgi:hypothetical protein
MQALLYIRQALTSLLQGRRIGALPAFQAQQIGAGVGLLGLQLAQLQIHRRLVGAHQVWQRLAAGLLGAVQVALGSRQGLAQR